ncbi:hypothetical protein [Arcticibacter sp. MXS-1]|uniref:hypothetical protein n=1 Tax=Arcticibacter sp. MXS-1 TaxID=3341726 RepID=UPI0035A8F8AB
MKKILTALLISAFICGCDKDLLDTTPYSAVSSDIMWTTDNLTDLGVGGVYSALRIGIGNSGNTSPYELYEMDRFGYTGESRGDEPLLMGTITPGNELFSTIWKYMYEGVQRANDAIVNIPLKSPSKAEKKPDIWQNASS